MQHTHTPCDWAPMQHTHSSCDKLWSQFCCNPVPGAPVLWTAKILWGQRQIGKRILSSTLNRGKWVSSARELENCLYCLILNFFFLTFSKWHSINWVQLSLSAGFTCTVSPSLYRFHIYRQKAVHGTRASSNFDIRPGSWGPSPS